MACSRNACCFSKKTKLEMEADFTKEFCAKFWSNALGADGQVQGDYDGLTINSQVFTATPSDATKGLFDNFKYNAYYKNPIYVKPGNELILETVAAAKQFYNLQKPFPDAFGKRVRDVFADPRLTHSQISLIDPDNGIIAGFALTDHATFALYGRLPLCEDQSWCSWAEPGPNECKPCATECKTKYNYSNFWEDCRYVTFKQTASYTDYCRFVNFIRWADNCSANGTDLYSWKLYVEWPGRGYIGEGLTESSWATWKAWNDWGEYQYFLQWNQWSPQEQNWASVYVAPPVSLPPPVGPCAAGSCSAKAYARAEWRKCSHLYAGAGNCYDAAQTVAGALGKELYPYQFSVPRNCLNYKGAQFLSLIELQRKEACDPLCDYSKLAVGINSTRSVINWYINNEKVYTHVGIGRRTAEEYRVRENGGYAEDVYVYRVLVDFGTGSLLDASLPVNYDRYRAKDDFQDMTNLVPLQDNLADPTAPTNYYQIYANKLGGLMNVNRAETFAVTTADPQYRVFGQGNILKLRYITVAQRYSPGDYGLPRVVCAVPCGTCNDKPGYCWDFCQYDGESDEEDCEDGRDYQIVKVSTTTGQVMPQTGSEGYVLKLVRTPLNKRFYDPKCPEGTGINPYNAQF